MQEIIQRVASSGKPITRQDIADLLAVVAEPGELRDVKREAVADMFKKASHSSANFQGFSVLDDLDNELKSFREY